MPPHPSGRPYKKQEIRRLARGEPVSLFDDAPPSPALVRSARKYLGIPRSLVRYPFRWPYGGRVL